MLYIRPVILGIDYFVNNLKGRKASKIDVESGGFIKRKAMSEIDENGKGILRGESHDQSVMGGCSGF